MRGYVMTTAAAALLFTVSSVDAAGPKASAAHHHDVGLVAASAGESAKVGETKSALRDLWLGHVFWVRNVVISAISGDKSAEKTAETEVVANAKAIAASIEPFYGAAAKDKLFGLLAGHYGAVKAYLEASLAKDSAKQAAAVDKLGSNAAEIATLLSGANPNLPKDAVLGLLQAHGGHHIAQIQQLQAADFAGEAKTWSDMTRHMYIIADALGGAIAKQFPEKFAAR